jgi:DNA-binding transcriptional LysR family regulator
MGLRFEFLLAGFGWANMPAHLAAAGLSNGQLVDLGIRDPSLTPEPLPIYAAHKRGSPPRQAAQWLLTDLQNRLAAEHG